MAITCFLSFSGWFCLKIERKNVAYGTLFQDVGKVRTSQEMQGFFQSDAKDPPSGHAANVQLAQLKHPRVSIRKMRQIH